MESCKPRLDWTIVTCFPYLQGVSTGAAQCTRHSSTGEAEYISLGMYIINSS